jgi:tetratricopeptide (TPR) repeat protein
VIGFAVEELQDFEVPGPEHELAPRVRFDASALALRNASAEHVILAGQGTYSELSTPDVVFFDLAVHEGTECDEEQAEVYWRACLDAGDPKAHFGLGYTLCDLGRPREAYGHLLEYTRILPRNGWGWTWLGQACEGMGEARQAARCYRRAIRLEADEGHETDAAERLERLQKRAGTARRRRR